jgi:hypothetical protein
MTSGLPITSLTIFGFSTPVSCLRHYLESQAKSPQIRMITLDHVGPPFNLIASLSLTRCSVEVVNSSLSHLQASGRTTSPVSIHLQRKRVIGSRWLSSLPDNFIQCVRWIE